MSNQQFFLLLGPLKLISHKILKFPHTVNIHYLNNVPNFGFFQHYVVDNGYLTADDFTDTSVRIKKLGKRQLGSYFCRAQNKLGSTEKEFIVVETYEPDCTVGLCNEFSSASSSKFLFFGLYQMIGALVLFLCVK